jgi:hypothetical protein
MKHARKDYNRIQDPEKKIGETEPVFLIRAKDKCMIPAMEAWLSAAIFCGVDTAMIVSVADHIKLTKKWQQGNGSKTPDL